ncbi:MAG: hypothetical protein G3M70_05055 [Candidatus Nitronauta litoralis]|uniref:Uncharacterized protein n=1 Tax=Candidatus Nitronauta litoralis TaxID=2705533 RepID=A0A7T0FZK6_9BACT|nr:MAG: hypothetical protein G3M70_05055 [Candidatus Nitronauta litoralis]
MILFKNRTGFVVFFAILVFSLAVIFSARAQQNTPTISKRDADLLSQVLKEKSPEKKEEKGVASLSAHDRALIEEVLKSTTNTSKKSEGKPSKPGQPAPDDKFLLLDEEYLQAYHDWKLYKIKIARETFTFHYWSSLIIFAVVLGIVFMGLYLTWVQVTMRIDAEKIREAEGKDSKGDGEKEQHQVEISAEGLKLKSSVVGLSILTVSLAFFYLYLVYVYPVNFVGQ